MKSWVVLVGFLVLLFGLVLFAWTETDYDSKMKWILNKRSELAELKAVAQNKYIQTGDPKYLHILAELEDLYRETFHLERSIKDARQLGILASWCSVFVGVLTFIIGIVAKEKSDSQNCKSEIPSQT